MHLNQKSFWKLCFQSRTSISTKTKLFFWEGIYSPARMIKLQNIKLLYRYMYIAHI